MGTDSDPPSGPAPNTAASAAVNTAVNAAANTPVADVIAVRAKAWRAVETRWPRRRWTLADYSQVTTLLEIYFHEVFPRLDPVRCRQIVAAAVEEFLTTWHRQAASRAHAGNRSPFPLPVDVHDAVMDAMLERGGDSRGTNAEVAPARAQPVGPSVRADISLTKVAVRAHPDAVRAGLRELFAEGDRDDFCVITAYLDLADPDLGRPPPTSKVVACLRGRVGEWPARQAIRSFQARVKRIEQRRIEQHNATP
jgi:hypothetical protein